MPVIMDRAVTVYQHFEDDEVLALKLLSAEGVNIGDDIRCNLGATAGGIDEFGGILKRFSLLPYAPPFMIVLELDEMSFKKLFPEKEFYTLEMVFPIATPRWIRKREDHTPYESLSIGEQMVIYENMGK